MSLGIRARLILLTHCVAVPLVIVGLVALIDLRSESERRLRESLERQAELAAVALERWVTEHVRGLSILALRMDQADDPVTLRSDLSILRARRPHMIDVSVLDPQGAVMMREPALPDRPPPHVAGALQSAMQQAQRWVVLASAATAGEAGSIAIGWPLRSGGALIALLAPDGVREVFANVQLGEGAVIAAFDQRGQLLYTDATPGELPDGNMVEVVNGRRTTVIEAMTGPDRVAHMHALALAATTNCVAMVAVPSYRLFMPARQQFGQYVVFSALGLMAAAVAAGAVARGILKPVRRLQEAAMRFGAGKLGTRAEIHGAGELGDLASAFNQMAALIEERECRLQELGHLKSDFVSSVSHELRTPLTTIKTLTRVLLRGTVSDEERREYLQTIASECDRQIDLVVNLLDLSRIEAGRMQVSVQPADVAAVVRQCTETMAPGARERGVTLDVHVPERLPAVLADAAALRRVVCGLLDNAIKYAKDGGAISITVSMSGSRLAVLVSDTGPGIPAEDLPHIFEKFYRAGSSTEHAAADDGPRHVPGIGLGLYIARTLVEEMGGRLDVKSELGRGAVFTVWLPIAPHQTATSEEVGPG